ncbi:MAG: hypothetical protein HOQ32_04875 [Lysobacter sp.]|nr:hypothetical protein [Lysobacter sp.]
MSSLWIFYLLPAFLVGAAVSELYAHAAEPRISKQAPDYARQLFRSQSQRMFSRLGLCRQNVLFFQPPPVGLEKTVKELRAAHLFSNAVVVAYVGSIAVICLWF